MKVKITFEREHHRYNNSILELRIYMRFSYCEYGEFYQYLDNNRERLNNMKLLYDVSYSEKVIYFS